ncbi:uncharacterized protein LOC135396489 [Ornithodoros turicata]|uniref:uncharacterized protein LOC135396489 n=1 Tax=Ornithodoros turicata TaxID=34597 RepID=UPI003138BA18
MSGITRCYVPGCTNTSGANPEVTFHKPRDSNAKRMWEAALVSRHPDLQGEVIHVSRICSSHFADDAYMETDSLQIRLGVPRRKRLKLDAVPTIFPERREQLSSAEVQSGSCTESASSDVERTESTSGVSPWSTTLQSMAAAVPERVLVLDELPLPPLEPYQIVSQYGFHYILVPHTP